MLRGGAALRSGAVCSGVRVRSSDVPVAVGTLYVDGTHVFRSPRVYSDCARIRFNAVELSVNQAVAFRFRFTGSGMGKGIGLSGGATHHVQPNVARSVVRAPAWHHPAPTGTARARTTTSNNF